MGSVCRPSWGRCHYFAAWGISATSLEEAWCFCPVMRITDHCCHLTVIARVRWSHPILQLPEQKCFRANLWPKVSGRYSHAGRVHDKAALFRSASGFRPPDQLQGVMLVARRNAHRHALARGYQPPRRQNPYVELMKSYRRRHFRKCSCGSGSSDGPGIIFCAPSVAQQRLTRLQIPWRLFRSQMLSARLSVGFIRHAIDWYIRSLYTSLFGCVLHWCVVLPLPRFRYLMQAVICRFLAETMPDAPDLVVVEWADFHSHTGSCPDYACLTQQLSRQTCFFF